MINKNILRNIQRTKETMSTGRWETINGGCYYNEESEMDTSDGCLFTAKTKEWNVVKRASLEEVLCFFVRKRKDWVKATEEEFLLVLLVKGFLDDYSTLGNIIVDMDKKDRDTDSGLLKQHLYLNSCGGKLG